LNKRLKQVDLLEAIEKDKARREIFEINQSKFDLSI